MKSLILNLIIELIILFCFIPVFSQEKVDYMEIRTLLERKDFSASQRKINSLLPDNPSDPDLLYLQAETWFQKAEFHYQKENYKTANDFYKQALTIWPNHQILNERITSLSKKNLTDKNLKEETPIKETSTGSSNKNETYIVVNEDISLIKIVLYNQKQDMEKPELSFPMKTPGYSIIQLNTSENDNLILLKPFAFAMLVFFVSVITLIINRIFRFLLT
jgi:tetratricopeptide (TPR) repeat protein